MSNIKEIIKKVLGPYNVNHLVFAKKVYDVDKVSQKTNIIKSYNKAKLIKYSGTKSDQLNKFLNEIILRKYDDKRNKYFYYTIDIYKKIFEPDIKIANLTIDYDIISKNSLNDIKKKVESNKKSGIYDEEIKTIEALENYIDRIVNYLKTTKCNKKIIDSIEGIKNRKANGLQDAIQRILFINQVAWQTDHTLMGLGRLDKILYLYYKKDNIREDETKKIITSFLNILHDDYYFKSGALAGDTGQIIILGGKNEKGKYECNDLTYIFIECIKELQLPDPKVLLRVSKDTPKDLMKLSLDTIKTGIGCPLFANDDIIIPKLINFGYDKEDAYNYATAACWEPYIPGKAFDQANIKSIVFIKPLEMLLEKENLKNINSFESITDKLEKYIENYINEFVSKVDKIKFAEDPFLSLFIDNCIKKGKDISEGGAKYNNFGFTGVGLPNLINSLINIKEIVYDKKKMTLQEFNELRKDNFNDNKDFIKVLKSTDVKYGQDDKFSIELTNKIVNVFTDSFRERKNPLGGKYKFGFSAPTYITESKNFPASFDGRKIGEPFNVHISCDSSNAYTELVEFASKLDYNENRFNGNVVDFFVSPSFIEDNYDKFLNFLMLSIKVGFFEMQMNVVSSKTLIEARKNPDKFPNLIVRVWGFSAYFKDLPDEYKDYLIERALQSEGNS